MKLKLKSGDVYYNKETNKHYLIPFYFVPDKRWVIEIETGATVIYTVLHDCVKLEFIAGNKFIRAPEFLGHRTIVRSMDANVWVVIRNDAEFILTNVKNGEQFSIPEFLEYHVEDFTTWLQIGSLEINEPKNETNEEEFNSIIDSKFKEFDHVIVGSSSCDDLDDVYGVVIEVSNDEKFKYLVETKGVKIWCAEDADHCGCGCDNSGLPDDRVNCFFIRNKI